MGSGACSICATGFSLDAGSGKCVGRSPLPPPSSLLPPPSSLLLTDLGTGSWVVANSVSAKPEAALTLTNSQYSVQAYVLFQPINDSVVSRTEIVLAF